MEDEDSVVEDDYISDHHANSFTSRVSPKQKAGAPLRTSPSSLSAGDLSVGGVGLSPEHMVEIFPFHLVVNSHFRILQIGILGSEGGISYGIRGD